MAVDSVLAGQGVPVQDCPPAPRPGADADPWAFHPAPALEADQMRRRRCLDVSVDAQGEGSPFSVWAWFRDTVGEGDGREAVLHEYCVEVSGTGTRLQSLDAEPRVLPFPECPGAASAVGSLSGVDVRELGSAVPEVLSGIASCTHLNDLLRALGGTDEILRVVRAEQSPGGPR
jgi:hypothetical protein